jgi:hypothetical protein
MGDWGAVSVLRRHRQWAMLIAAAATLLIAAGAVSLTIVENVSKGPPFQSAARYLRSARDAEVARMQLGAVMGFGLAVTGPISESGDSGTAHLSFDVHGNWRSGHVRITAVKRDSRWVVTGGTLTVDGEKYHLPCARPTSITSCRVS